MKLAAIAIIAMLSMPALAQEVPNCIPFTAVKEMVVLNPERVQNFRFVKNGLVRQAIESIGADVGPFNRAALVDAGPDGGILVVGIGESACSYVRVRSFEWEKLKLLVEGNSAARGATLNYN